MLNVLSEFVRLSALLSSQVGSSTQPRKDWYELLALILTRAVLEGYVLHGWRGTRAAQVLFGFGGSNAKPPSSPKRPSRDVDSDSDSDSSEEEDDEAEFSPDGYPSLADAYRKLFPSSLSGSSTSTQCLEELRAFREEMGRRRSEFLSPAEIPSGGLDAHIKALNEKYSAESLDKKMIEFMERVAGWKGGAPLERTASANSKKLNVYFSKPPPSRITTSTRNPSSMDIVEGESDESDSQSEDETEDEKTPPASLNQSSKRPRATSLSDNVPTTPTETAPPLKRERLGVSA